MDGIPTKIETRFLRIVLRSFLIGRGDFMMTVLAPVSSGIRRQTVAAKE